MLHFLDSFRGRITDEEFPHFLSLMTDFKKGTIHIQALTASIKLLLGDRHPDLILAFNSFVPAEHNIEEVEEPEEEDDAHRFLDLLKARVDKDDYMWVLNYIACTVELRSVWVFNYIGMHSPNEISMHDLFIKVAEVLESTTAGTGKKRPRDLDYDSGDDTKRRSREKGNGGSSADKLEHVLQVEHGASLGRLGEQQELRGDLALHGVDDEVVEGTGVELKAGGLALDVLEVAVGVEDAVAKEVLEMGDEVRALGEVVEAGREHVLDDGRVSGDDNPDVT